MNCCRECFKGHKNQQDYMCSKECVAAYCERTRRKIPKCTQCDEVLLMPYKRGVIICKACRRSKMKAKKSEKEPDLESNASKEQLITSNVGGQNEESEKLPAKAKVKGKCKGGAE